MKKIVFILVTLIVLSILGIFIWRSFFDKPPVEEVIYLPVQNIPEKPEELEGTEGAELPEMAERPEGPELSEMAERPEGSEKPEETEITEEPETVAVTIPGSFVLDVMFATQAPTQDWGMPYQEACEEASLIMSYYYFADKYLDRPIMNEEILALVAWEEERFGYYKDTTLAETQIIADEYFNLDTEISVDISEENIKYQLSQGNLLVIPFAGRMLENPYFSGEGPLFHMLVVKGYDHKDFITNDPGLLTKGESFHYSYENLLESVHDWNGGDVENGRRVMLIVKGLK